MTRTELSYALCALLSTFLLGLGVGLLAHRATPSAVLLAPAFDTAPQPPPITPQQLDNA